MFVSGYLNCQRSKTEKDDNQNILWVYNAAYKGQEPCSDCGKQHQYHHATCDGRNLCHDCYLEQGCPVTQCYPGDKGYSPFGSTVAISGSYNAS